MTEIGNPLIASMRGKQLRSKDASGFSQGYSLLYAAFVELAQVKLNSRHAKEKFVPSTVLSGKKKKKSHYFEIFILLSITQMLRCSCSQCR